MKKIYITLFTLLAAMMAMAWLYFSRLNLENASNDISLYAATAHSGLVFSVRNDMDILGIIAGQNEFKKLVGVEKYKQLSQLKSEILSGLQLKKLLADKSIYISFLPGKKQNIDYLISSQLNNEQEKVTLLNTLKSSKIQINAINNGWILTLKDSTLFYLGIKNNLVVLSNDSIAVTAALHVSPDEQLKGFAAFIKNGSKFSKNSLANLYIDFNKLPAFLRVVLPGKLKGELTILDKQNSFAALSYNFSKERLFFNGNLKINDKSNYLELFSGLAPQKNTIDNILPENTANFTLYAIPDYTVWSHTLNDWFAARSESDLLKKTISSTNQKYHLNPDQIFPKYFKNQLICFQLNTAEKLGAIELHNGEKVTQLLLDISGDYNADIKLLKQPDLLYCYFGAPFRKFKTPYYTIIDNYMVFSNYPSSLEAFLNAYRNNKLLINTPAYSNLYNQIPDEATVTFYVHPENSAELVHETIYNKYYRHFKDKEGLNGFSDYVYQMSGDHGIFQTNLLLNGVAPALISAPGKTE